MVNWLYLLGVGFGFSSLGSFSCKASGGSPRVLFFPEDVADDTFSPEDSLLEGSSNCGSISIFVFGELVKLVSTKLMFNEISNWTTILMMILFVLPCLKLLISDWLERFDQFRLIPITLQLVGTVLLSFYYDQPTILLLDIVGNVVSVEDTEACERVNKQNEHYAKVKKNNSISSDDLADRAIQIKDVNKLFKSSLTRLEFGLV